MPGQIERGKAGQPAALTEFVIGADFVAEVQREGIGITAGGAVETVVAGLHLHPAAGIEAGEGETDGGPVLDVPGVGRGIGIHKNAIGIHLGGVGFTGGRFIAQAEAGAQLAGQGGIHAHHGTVRGAGVIPHIGITVQAVVSAGIGEPGIALAGGGTLPAAGAHRHLHLLAQLVQVVAGRIEQHKLGQHIPHAGQALQAALRSGFTAGVVESIHKLRHAVIAGGQPALAVVEGIRILADGLCHFLHGGSLGCTAVVLAEHQVHAVALVLQVHIAVLQGALVGTVGRFLHIIQHILVDITSHGSAHDGGAGTLSNLGGSGPIRVINIHTGGAGSCGSTGAVQAGPCRHIHGAGRGNDVGGRVALSIHRGIQLQQGGIAQSQIGSVHYITAHPLVHLNYGAYGLEVCTGISIGRVGSICPQCAAGGGLVGPGILRGVQRTDLCLTCLNDQVRVLQHHPGAFAHSGIGHLNPGTCIVSICHAALRATFCSVGIDGAGEIAVVAVEQERIAAGLVDAAGTAQAALQAGIGLHVKHIAAIHNNTACSGIIGITALNGQRAVENIHAVQDGDMASIRSLDVIGTLHGINHAHVVERDTCAVIPAPGADIRLRARHYRQVGLAAVIGSIAGDCHRHARDVSILNPRGLIPRTGGDGHTTCCRNPGMLNFIMPVDGNIAIPGQYVDIAGCRAGDAILTSDGHILLCSQRGGRSVSCRDLILHRLCTTCRTTHSDAAVIRRHRGVGHSILRCSRHGHIT